MKTLACVMMTVATGAGADTTPESLPDRPNILFVYCDDHAAHAISAYGSQINTTPNIDRLASEGMLFENSFVTNSICAPARAVVLTGRFSHLNGVMTNGETFDGTQQTFVPLMNQAGYETAIVGKWHLKSEPTGFDHFEVLQGQGPYYNPVLRTPAGNVLHEGYTTDVITDRALAWLENRDTNRPFMLMYQHKAPHRNWMPSPAHFDLYEGEEIKEPTTLFDDYDNRLPGAGETEMTIAHHMFGMYDLKLPIQFEEHQTSWETRSLLNLSPEQREAFEAGYKGRNDEFLARWNAGELTGDELTRFKYQRYIKDYLRVIASVDDNLGRVLDFLDETGQADNTIVIYTSDQGFFLGDHGWYDKRWMYEHSLRSPLIVRWPTVTEPGSRSEALVQNLDFAQTFLDIAGAIQPATMQGQSIVPILKGDVDDASFRDAIYYHYYEYPAPHRVPAHYGVRTERYKLIRYPMYDGWELFDLAVDPDEMVSVYDAPGYEPVREELMARLKELQEAYGDTEPDLSASERAQRNLAAKAAATPTALAYTQGGNSDLDPSNKPLTVGARVVVPDRDGVVAAHGGGSFGYALYFEDQVPCFTVRESGEMFTVRGRELNAGESHHVVGVINRASELEIWVDGSRINSAAGRFITNKPGEGFDIGIDSGSAVGPYADLRHMPTPIDDLRVYWGTISARDLSIWHEASKP